MCVAVVMAPDTELSVKEIDQMRRANGDGAGFAYADGSAVHWVKALHPDPEKVLALLEKHKEFPRLLHFRLSTVGGVKIELCHPFEVGPRAANSAKGSGAKVLIHNGHWHSWTQIFNLFKDEKILPDTGPWSDTRFAAFCASMDNDWLDIVGGKVATMDAEGNIKMWGSWDKLRPGLLVSNEHWKTHTYDYTRSGNNRHMIGWNWTEKEWEEWARHHEDIEDTRKQASKELEDEQKREAEQAKKREEGEKGKDGHKRVGGFVGMGNGPRHWSSYPSHGTQGGNAGRALGPGNGERGDVQGSSGQSGDKHDAAKQEGAADGAKGTAGSKGAQIFNHTPWQNPVTKKWWYIPWSCEESGRTRFDELSELRAGEILKQIAAQAPEGK